MNSPLMLMLIREFEKVKRLSFNIRGFFLVNKGLYNNSCLPPAEKYRGWMEFY